MPIAWRDGPDTTFNGIVLGAPGDTGAVNLGEIALEEITGGTVAVDDEGNFEAAVNVNGCRYTTLIGYVHGSRKIIIIGVYTGPPEE